MQTKMLNCVTTLVGILERSPEALRTPVAPAASSVSTDVSGSVASGGTVNNTVNNIGPTTNVVVQNVEVTIRPWDSVDDKGRHQPLVLTAEMLRGAFTENKRLEEYKRMTDAERTDVDIAPPYVAEAIIELLRRAHAAPENRNVYLNPKRADQVHVLMKSGIWQIMALTEAQTLLREAVARGYKVIVWSSQCHKEFTTELQGALAWIPRMHDDNPKVYEEALKAQITAHLTNMIPAGLATRK